MSEYLQETDPRKRGREFEDLCLKRAAAEERLGRATMKRYGVQANYEPKTKQFRPLSSFPDFDGNLTHGKQFVFDAKVVAGPSMPMSDSNAPTRQRDHLLRKWRWGVPSFYLVHLLPRQLKKSQEAEMTIALPTDPEMDEWKAVVAGTKKSFDREELCRLGFIITWSTPPRARKKLPNFLPAVIHFVHRIRDTRQLPTENFLVWREDGQFMGMHEPHEYRHWKDRGAKIVPESFALLA